MNEFYRPPRPPIRKSLPAFCLLSLAVAIAFNGVIRNGFVNFDDIEYIFDNSSVYAGLSLDGLIWALRATYEGNWFPLTWLSHMADMSLYGAKPAGHHLTSLLFHLCNTVLLQQLLTRLTGSVWRSAAAAALFALHPLQVESVAWVAERKNVLSTFFFLLTLLAYCRYVTARTALNYAAVVAGFICGLASKPMLVTLPFVLLLLDWWPLGRFAGAPTSRDPAGSSSPADLLREKVPLILISACSSAITIYAQQAGGAIKGSGATALAENVAHALVHYVRYLVVIFRPADLAVLYPYEQDLPLWQPPAALALLALLSYAAYRARSRRPWLTFGWFWFLITLVPVVGFIRIGAHAIADRYLYLPLIGIAVALAWAAGDQLPATGLKRAVAAAGGIVLCGALILATRKQVDYWHDSLTLFGHAVAVTDGNWLAHNNLTVELVKRGRIDEAFRHVQESIRINPANPDAYYNLGKIYANRGDNMQAITAYRQAIALDPGYGNAYVKLVMLLIETGDRRGAADTYRDLQRVAPDKARLLTIP